MIKERSVVKQAGFKSTCCDDEFNYNTTNFLNAVNKHQLTKHNLKPHFNFLFNR